MNKTKMLISIYFIVFFLPLVNNAQSTGWTYYNSNNSGLPSDYVFQIRQDSLNNMWFATLSGLVRFDGENWEVFNRNSTILPSPPYDFQFDSKGHIWMLSGPYLVDFDYSQKYMRLIEIDSLINSFNSDICEVLHIDHNDTKWLGHYTKLIKYDDQKFQTYLYGENIASIFSIEDSLFVGSWAHSINFGGKLLLSEQWDSTGNPMFNNITEHLQTSVFGIDIRDIYKDKFERIWVSFSEGVASLENNEWKTYDKNDFQPNSDISGYSMGVALDQNDNLWVALLFDGVAIFDGSSWRRISDAFFINNFNLPNYTFKIWEIFGDNKGRIWLGTEYGILIYSGDITSVDEIKEPNYNLDISCYPNPFNNTTNINYTLKEQGKIKIDIYNILGERIKTLVDDFKKTGAHSITFDGENLSSGVYFLTFQHNNSYIKTIKAMLNK